MMNSAFVEKENMSSGEVIREMEEIHIKRETTIGLCLIGISLLCQVFALVLMRILHRLREGGMAVVFRMWLYLACALDQVSFLIFHLKYNVFVTDLDVPDACIVLRFLTACTSTFLMTWLFVLAAFYFGLTVQPSRCFSFHARFLAYCFTHTWTCVSCLMYLMMAFLLRRRHYAHVIFPCWTNVAHTIHLYLTYGNELIIFFLTVLLVIITQVRIRLRRRQIEIFSHRREFKHDFAHLTHNVNILLLVIVLVCGYYCSLLFRIVLDGVASDLSIMIIHSMKGFVIVLTTCFLDKHVIDLLRCTYRQGHTNGIMRETLSQHDRQELSTFALD